MLAECGDLCCQPWRSTVQWWHGLWMIQVFPSRESIPSESLGSTAVRSGNKIMPGGGEFISQHMEREFANCLATLSARGVVPGFRALPESWSARVD